MARILVKDLGVRMRRKIDGVPMYRMQFSYACDQMEIGKDAPMAQTYLQIVSHNEKTGKTYSSRDYYFSKKMYNKLMLHVFTEGCEGSRWTGIVDAAVKKLGTDREYRQILDLSAPLRKLDVPFDEARHNAFVKESQEVVRQQRVAEMECKFPEVSHTEMEKRLGD